MKKPVTRFLFLITLVLYSNILSAGKVVNQDIISGTAPVISKRFIPVNPANLKISGRKLSIKEKLVWKIYKSKLKKEKRKAAKEQYSKRTKTAFLLSILSLVTIIIFPVSVILAIISMTMASKSIHENYDDKKARTAMTLSFLALGLVVVSLLIYVVFISDGEFGIFVL